LLDCGRPADTTYDGRLTAVDRAGNESPAAAVAPARTGLIDGRFLERFPVTLKTRSQIHFGYTCQGHDGPMLGHSRWNHTAPRMEREGRHAFGYPLGAGQHTIEIGRVGGDDLVCSGVTVTNDRGFLPRDACTSFLPMAGK